MEKTASAPIVTDYANEEMTCSAIMQNQYFQALKDGSMSLESFRRSQEQFLFAVAFFPRPMAALVGRIPDARQRLDILHNLVEEHGEFNEQAFHCTTFQQFLVSVGREPKETDDLVIHPAVRAFNSVLTCACV